MGQYCTGDKQFDSAKEFESFAHKQVVKLLVKREISGQKPHVQRSEAQDEKYSRNIAKAKAMGINNIISALQISE